MRSKTTRGARLAALALALVACNSDRLIAPGATVNGGSAALAVSMPSVRISEFHYDNFGTDTGERIEVSGPAGTSFVGWQIVRYNGANPAAGITYTGSSTSPASLTFPDQCNGRGTLVFSYAVDGLQNGGADGFALVNGTTVVEFLSYEGQMTASNGPAAGMTSVDVGISQSGSATLDPVGASLQRSGAGVWTRTAANTFGSCNDADEVPPAVVASVNVSPATLAITAGNSATLSAIARDASGNEITGVAFTWTSNAPAVATVTNGGVVSGVAVGSATITAKAPNGVEGTSVVTVSPAAGAAANVRVSEFHYDNDGTDTGERIEVEGDVGGSLAGWKIFFYSGSTGSTTAGKTYDSISLNGSFGNACVEGTRGVLTFAASGLQNGDKDGFALVNASGEVVEFLSYEGSFAAVDGPAAGLTATDVGVSQSGTGSATRSIQRAGNGTWFGPYTSTFDACNADTPPAPLTGIQFTGRTPSDPALPVGYQDQIFANLKDENTGATVPTTFTWTSETPSIATVDQRGVISALSAGSAVIRATAVNGVTNTITLPIEIAPLGDSTLYRNPLAFGIPSDGTPFDELRVSRPQYELSYNSANGTPNWVAYHLSKTVRGNLSGYRCDCFTPDPAVTPIGDPGISTADYTNSGFDRGHMVRSNDRELARGDQARTYYMSNIVPQYGNQNQGRWADLESYLQTVADGGSEPEIYIFTGPRGEAGRIGGGRIAVPTHTWKVAVVLRAGMTPAQVTSQSDVLDLIAVDMPNISTLARDGNWQAHKTTVDAIEALTGYDVLSALPNVLEAILESGDRAPTARLTGSGVSGGNEGQALAFDATTSSDPDVGGTLNDVLSFEWAVNGVVVGSQPALTHTFADDGTYTLRLIATDRFGAADTASTSVVILNVAPVVNAFSGATILRGETYAATGTFSDAGADTFTGNVTYGDGFSSGLLLGANSFALAHTYATAGTYTVTVTVTDDDGASASRTATVTVLSSAQAVGSLTAKVLMLEEAGTLSKGEANALDASLRNALKSIERGTESADNQLGAFINKVEAMQRSGRLDATTAASLIGYANRIIASIG